MNKTETEKLVEESKDFLVINRNCVGHAYAKNGNQHNPTPKYRWEVFYRGKHVGGSYTLSGAKELGSDFSNVRPTIVR